MFSQVSDKNANCHSISVIALIGHCHEKMICVLSFATFTECINHGIVDMRPFWKRC